MSHSLRLDTPLAPVRFTQSFAFLLSGAMLALGLGVVAWWSVAPAIVAEDHWIEWLQVGLLLAAFAALARRGTVGSTAGMLRLGIALIALTIAIREVDIDRLGTGPWWPLLERVVRIVAAALWALWAGRAAMHLPAIWRSVPALSRVGWIRVTAGAGLFFALSYPFDKALLPLPADVSLLLEELMELEGAAMLLAAALAQHPEEPAA
jgi:hypothetical protein